MSISKLSGVVFLISITNGLIGQMNYGTIQVKKIEESTDTTSVQTEKPKLIADKQASFPGGADSLKWYLNKHQRMPQEALNDKLEGWVIVRFLIDERGEVQMVHALDFSNRIFVYDAEQLIKKMPLWEAAYEKGIPVKQMVTLKVDYLLPY